VAYLAGRALGSRRAGLLAAALTATSPFMIWYSQEARPYALFAFLSALAFLFFVKTLQERGSRSLWAWAIASILAFGTHYFGFILTAVEAAWLLWRMRGWRTEVALSIGVVGAAALPLLPLALAQRGHVGWIALIAPGDRTLQVPQHFVVGLNSPWAILPPLAVAAVAAVVLYAVARADPPALRGAALPGGVALATVALPVVATLVGSDYLLTRNLIGSWVPLAIALGVLLGAPALKRLGPASVAALCMLGLALAVWNAATPAAGRPDWDPLAGALGSPDVPRLIEYPSPFVVPLVQHLANARLQTPGERDTVQEIDVVDLRPVPDYSVGPCVGLAICGGKNLLGPQGKLAVPIPRRFKLVGQGRTSLFTYRRYRGPRPVKLPPADPFVHQIIQSAS